MSDLDFTKLTKAQRAAVDSIAIGGDGSGHTTRVLQKLIDLGFIVAREQRLPGMPPVIITVYDMPIHVHIRWAQQCSAEVDAETKR